MSYKPHRTFNGQPGEASVDSQGPLYLSNDIDEINKMFDPTSIHENGERGGISKENLDFEISNDFTDKDKEDLGIALNHANIVGSNPHGTVAKQVNITKIDGLSGTDAQSALENLSKKASDHEKMYAGSIDLVQFDNASGTFKFYKVSDHLVPVFSIDTPIEKVVVNFEYDSSKESLILTYPDGSKSEIPLTSFISEYDFVNTDDISFSVDNHKVSAAISTSYKTELTSLTERAEAAMNNAESFKDMAKEYSSEALSNYSKAKLEADRAELKSSEAEKSADDSLDYKDKAFAFAVNASESKDLAKSWAVGGTGIREGEDVNNAKYWAEQAKEAVGADMQKSVYDADGDVELAGGIKQFVNNNSSKNKAFSVTLYPSLWTGNTNVIVDNEFLKDGFMYTISPDVTSYAAWTDSEIYAENITVDGVCTFVCKNIPTDSILVNILKSKI